MESCPNCLSTTQSQKPLRFAQALSRYLLPKWAAFQIARILDDQNPTWSSACCWCTGCTGTTGCFNERWQVKKGSSQVATTWRNNADFFFQSKSFKGNLNRLTSKKSFSHTEASRIFFSLPLDLPFRGTSGTSLRLLYRLHPPGLKRVGWPNVNGWCESPINESTTFLRNPTWDLYHASYGSSVGKQSVINPH